MFRGEFRFEKLNVNVIFKLDCLSTKRRTVWHYKKVFSANLNFEYAKCLIAVFSSCSSKIIEICREIIRIDESNGEFVW